MVVCQDVVVGEDDAYDVELPLFPGSDTSFIEFIKPRDYEQKIKRYTK